MFCFNCGKEVLDTAKFCSECGTAINSTNEPVMVIQSPEPPQIINKNIMKFHDIEFDINEFVRKIGFSKMNAIKHVQDLTGASLFETKAFIDTLYHTYKMNYNNQNQIAKPPVENKFVIERRELLEKLKQYDKEGIPYCPKCYSTSLTANKKGFGVGKAVVGAALTGGIGLVAGNINAKKVNITCLKCGYQFKPGKR